MEEFYLTFGLQYPSEQHPLWPDGTSEGWVRILAEDYATAREIAVSKFSTYWAFLYPANRFDASTERQYYPMGELLCLT